MVTTGFGNHFLDICKQITVEVNERSKVKDLKAAIEAEFPGNPPAELQHVTLGMRSLDDDEQSLLELVKDREFMAEGDSWGDDLDLSAGAEVPLVLDIPPPACGTTHATATSPAALAKLKREGRIEALAACLSSLQQLAVFADKLMTHSQIPTRRNEEDLVCHRLGLQIESFQSLIRSKREEVRRHLRALEEAEQLLAPPHHETEPHRIKEKLALRRPRTVSGRLVRFLNENLNIDWEASLKVSVACLCMSYFGPDHLPATTRRLFLLAAPGVFVVQSRPFRILQKLLWHIIPVTPLWNAFGVLSVLPAPQQELLMRDQRAFEEDFTRLRGSHRAEIPVGVSEEGLWDEDEEDDDDDDEDGGEGDEEEDEGGEFGDDGGMSFSEGGEDS
uniref:Uncharacterized protein n=1 Tax=Chromera velia CCMP2878 TaxID=1169474 RepID=A0A0G4I8X8_9ALVE|eukprot:Cvel_12055.t1-p1 / transcript=Cvel_12055.t1 / gene=Cvel_12055 / organism=Chromera_velia_CCMP2878 / gene_product=hypothetical protein / transcript_product=hypothetical protein / location=Cvel_scaffold775:3499-4662(+) / protein_length=388 / sequence_SO=supercontig / SO=protein_coding / is_pseudo=false